jgi:O-antigen/teichoic acid export membrane protein
VTGAISWLLLERILRVASGVLVSTTVARYLGPASYGTLAVALGVVGVASAAAGMGADHINLAQLSRHPGPGFLASALVARLLWSGACTLVLFVVAMLVWPAQLQLFVVLGGMVLATAPLVFLHQMYADNQFRGATAFGIVAIVAAVAARLAGVAWQLDLAWFAACAVLESAAMVLAAAVWVWRRGGWLPSSASLVQAGRYLRLCLPTLASAVLVALYFRIELLVVDAVLGAHAVGTWSAAMMFILPWNMASAAVLPVMNRRLGALGDDGAAGRNLMVRLVRAMLLLALACVVVNVVAVQFAVPLLLGSRYAQAATIAMVASLALVPLFMGAVQDVWLAQTGRNGVVLRKVLVGIPLSVALLWTGASQAGLVGAAAGMVVSYLITAILLNAVLDRGFLGIQLAAIGVGRG